MLNISLTFPTKSNAPDAAYAYGSARNITSPNDGTGTPLVESWLNDWFGFQQAVVLEAAIVPSNTSDTGAISQVFDGFKTVFVPRSDLSSLGGSTFVNFGTVAGSFNAAAGANALASNVSGNNCAAFGSGALTSTTLGGGNTAVGTGSLGDNEDGASNTAVGWAALGANISGVNNVAVGVAALQSNTATNNTAVGTEALKNNIVGGDNTAVGTLALRDSTGADNTAVGYGALSNNTGGGGNTAVGKLAQASATLGTFNTSVGWSSLENNLSGSSNIAIGANTLLTTTIGDDNTAVGDSSLTSLTGNDNSGLGSNSGGGGTPSVVTNCTFLGKDSAVTGANQVQLGNSGTTTYAYGAVQDRSDRRDKTDITPIGDAEIAFFMAVEWRTFKWDYREDYGQTVETEVDGVLKKTYVQHESDGSKTRTRPHVGAIAQQVEEAMLKHGVDFAGLQHHDIKGGNDVYSIGYAEFIGIQGEIIQRQQRTLGAVLARLDALEA